MLGPVDTRLLRIALPLIVGLVGVFLQSQTFLNHDVAWVLYSSQWLLEGKQFGRDIIVANPPFVWWLSAIPQAISDAIGVSSIVTFRIFVALMILVSLFTSNAILRDIGTTKASRFLFLVVGAYVFTIGVHRDFGQREFLTVLLILPYLLAAALRMRGENVAVAAAVAIGLAAGFGIAFKPYFIAVPLLVEGALIVRRRSLRTIWRLEALAAVASAGLCLIGLLLFARPWLTEALPDIARVYWAFDAPITAVVLHFAGTLGLLALSIYFVWRTGWPEASAILLLAAVGFAISAILQAKGYSYHIYPTTACMLLALALCAPGMVRMRSLGLAVFCVAFASNLATSVVELYVRSAHGSLGQEPAKSSRLLTQMCRREGLSWRFRPTRFLGFQLLSMPTAAGLLQVTATLPARGRSLEDATIVKV